MTYEMGKEILTFGDTEIEENKVYYLKSPIFLKAKLDIEKVLVSLRFLLVKKTLNTLLVTCIMIIKVNHYI